MEPSHPTFRHPYQPYEIQLEFMTKLYQCIENAQVGILESPTGTGKSLSLICGSLTWLRDHKRRILNGELDGEQPDTEDWLAQAEQTNRRREILRAREEQEEKLAKVRREESRRQQASAKERPAMRKRLNDSSISTDNLDDFMLDDYESGNEASSGEKATGEHLSASALALMAKLQGPVSGNEEAQPEEETKIIFCSRTHSQLTQFVHELRRVKPPATVQLPEGDVAEATEAVKHLALGSRKNLCINSSVAQLGSTHAINERCLELQKPSVAKDKKCPYLPGKEDHQVLEAFRHRAIARIRDIEDIAHLGRDMEVCPYYASRQAIPPGEVLTLPYPLLLQKSAREALGVSVKGNVVVIDEAHNLMDAIADTFSISMRLSQLRIATQQVTAYVQRFKNKLKGKNRVYITQVIRLLNSISDCLEQTSKDLQHQDAVITAAQLMSGKGVDQIKPHKLLQYLHESKLTHKVEGYTQIQEAAGTSHHHKGLLMTFQNLLIAIMNPDGEGRFFASRQEDDVVIRYALLDPEEHFRDIVEQARAVILAGGTMSPMSDYAEHLFSYLPAGKLQTYTFGHVIPQENMLAQPVARGPSNIEFDFTFGKRGSESIIIELGSTILRVVKTVPDGVVVFFPSYDYLSQVLKVWKRSTMGASMFENLGQQKCVFEEAKGLAVDDLLRKFAQSIDEGKGGLLLSVIGGKLSEGINFSDRLGRAVVCVGLPFPNASGGEWKAKIEHIEAAKLKQSLDSGLSQKDAQIQAKAAGRDFYENACMRAVNQSIGRAIRHRDDYAAILLVDRRFATGRITRKLPGWIRESMTDAAEPPSWKSTEEKLGQFFAGKDVATK
jgi:chromosome transmission fidelity protein 1